MRLRSGLVLAAIAMLVLLEACAPKPHVWYDRMGRAQYGGTLERVAGEAE